jgi:hypothetical protein
MENQKTAKADIIVEGPQIQLPVQANSENIETDSAISGNYQVLFNLEDQVENMNMLLLARSNDLMASALKVEQPKFKTLQRYRDPKTGRFAKAWTPETYVNTGELELEEKLKNKS